MIGTLFPASLRKFCHLMTKRNMHSYCTPENEKKIRTNVGIVVFKILQEILSFLCNACIPLVICPKSVPNNRNP